MLLQRKTGERLAHQLDELRCDRPRWWQELTLYQARHRGQCPDAEEREQARTTQHDELAPGERRAYAHRVCHGIARVSSHASAIVISAPAIATPIIPTTIIAGKMSSPA